ncbi:adenylate/guanylate cyclase domain-containing protein [Arcanobacterium hippocoleae]|uniref:Adenylate cyclase n=1 Tax=Arcanobacterium hippocoleae TaxID=149017 RepID=A0ABU1T3I5_9ACTO|nr:adenylate/guanylate cyclase domain-containing protein [Arcanobacterium hippocoleae]MDR6939948.1 adenylate cyclase [Arcanobacterium hippocoleae]
MSELANSQETPREPRQRIQPTTVENHVVRLLGGAAKCSLKQAAEVLGCSTDSIRRFWRSMGFPGIVNPDKKLFTDYDLDVIRAHFQMREDGLADFDTLNSLIRAQSHLADRMVLWQHEALVEEFEGRYGIDEISARYMLLDKIDQYEEFLTYQMKYAWRRHLAALLRRSETELDQQLDGTQGQMPLKRALGFVDLVSFTHRSGELSPHALVDFIQTFEFTCRDVISTHGARVVKMVGDAVLYIADDIATGIASVDGIVESLRENPYMPDVRASLVWGGVVSRFGDVFGPKVNLASRLCNVAPLNGILVDYETARKLRSLDPDAFEISPYEIPELQGIGNIEAAQVQVLRREVKSE